MLHYVLQYIYGLNIFINVFFREKSCFLLQTTSFINFIVIKINEKYLSNKP